MLYAGYLLIIVLFCCFLCFVFVLFLLFFLCFGFFFNNNDFNIYVTVCTLYLLMILVFESYVKDTYLVFQGSPGVFAEWGI